jgi:6,7-dimethyl-8-ribityllumazine synthase
MKIGIVVSNFNKEITSKMEEKALAIAKELNADVVETIHVQGAFEIPIITNKLLKNKIIEGVVTLGAVIQGGTDHDVIIMNSIGPKLLDLSLQYNKPVALGILGPRITRAQAEERAEKYAERAVRTTVDIINKL